MGWFSKKSEKAQIEAARVLAAREPRLRVIPLRGIFAEVDQLPGNRIDIGNISASGAGFIADAALSWPSKGAQVSGSFVVGEEKVAFVGELVHSTGQIVGVRYTGDNTKIRKMVFDYFDLELRARAMIQVKQEMLKAEPDGKPSWFRSASGFELYFVEGPSGDVIYYNMTFLGHYLEFGRGSPLRYGQIVDVQSASKPQYKGTEVVRYMTEIPEDTRASAVRMVENISGLGEKAARFFLNEFAAKR